VIFDKIVFVLVVSQLSYRVIVCIALGGMKGSVIGGEEGRAGVFPSLCLFHWLRIPTQMSNYPSE